MKTGGRDRVATAGQRPEGKMDDKGSKKSTVIAPEVQP